MANTRISNLTASASNLASTDLAPVVQTAGVGPVKMTGLQLAGGLLGSTTFNGATVTTSQPVLNLTQTWNAGAVTFTGLKFNATDTASASGSLLLDLQVGGVSKIRIQKDGAVVWTGSGYLAAGSGTNLVLNVSGGGNIAAQGTITINTNANDKLQFGTTQTLTWNNDLILSRAAAATLQLGAADAAAPVAQFFKVQGVVAGTSNTAGANFTIQGSQGTGTGAGGSIIFQVAPAGSAGPSQNGYSTALTIAGTKVATFSNDVILSNDPAHIYLGGTGNSNVLLRYTSGLVQSLLVRTGDNSAYANIVVNNLQLGAASQTVLNSDAANTLALRNGTNAQRFNVYNTYTSSTNYETFKVDWITTANTCLIGTEKGPGGGTARALALQTDGTTRLTIGTTGGASISGVLTSPVGNDAPAFLIQSNIGAGNGVALSVTEVNDATIGAGISANLNTGSAVGSGNRLGYYFFGGASNNANTISRSAGIASFATQNWSGTQSASDLRFYTTANTTTSRTERWKIENDGMFLASADNTYDIGAATATRPRNIYAATSIRATGSTAVIGYGTGAGGAVTQATSRTTGVTLNKGCGQITLVSAAGTTSWQSFTVSNTTVAATDTIIVNQDSGTDLYQIFVTNVAANSFQITFATTGGTTTEQPVFSFAVIKAVAA